MGQLVRDDQLVRGLPDFEGWLVPGQGGERWKPKRVQLWVAGEDPVAPEEWNGFLRVEGLEGYDPPRPVPGGSPLQATHLTFAHLRQIEVEQRGIVTSWLLPDDPEPG